MHSKMYDKIKKWHEQELWTAEMVHEAVNKGLITEEEYREIVEAQG